MLLSTTGNTCETSDIFWLRAQILLSSNQPGDLLKLARQEAQEGSLARLWWRMEAVKAALVRCGKEGQKEWEAERQWVAEMLQKDDGSYVLSDSLWLIKSYTTTQTAQLCFLPISVVDYSKFHRS